MAPEEDIFHFNIALDPTDFAKPYIPGSAYAEILNDLIKILSEIEASISVQEKHSEWGVESEAEIRIVASVNGVSAETLERVVKEAMNGFATATRKDSAGTAATPRGGQKTLNHQHRRD